MTEVKKEGLKQIVLTAVITAILTAATSSFLTTQQQKGEQEYWDKRFQKEGQLEILNKRIQLLEEINEQILASEVLMKELKLETAMFNTTLLNSDIEYDFEPSQLTTKVINYHKHVNKLSSKLQMLPIYFGDSVNTLIGPLQQAIEKNYDLGLLDIETLSSVKNAGEFFARNFNTIEELKTLRLELVESMFTEIHEVGEIVYSETK